MADRTISSKRVVRTAPVEVSPISTLPPGLDEGQYREVVIDDTSNYDDVSSGLDMPAPTETGGALLDTPTGVYIKEQIFRFLPGGEMVVDVIVAFDEVEGAEDYEVRYTKVRD